METIPENNTVLSSANGTDDREARSFRWYAARTQMNCERKVEKRFQQFACETYLPIQEEIHQWSDRKKKIQRMVIPMILFVKINKEDAQKVHAHKDSQFFGFLSTDRIGHNLAVIPDKDIETLKYMLGHSSQSIDIIPTPIRLGDRVRILRGELKGLEGYVMECRQGETPAVIIKLNILGCAKVNIHKNDLEHI
jgi:transcription antitermination factor NusG